MLSQVSFLLTSIGLITTLLFIAMAGLIAYHKYSNPMEMIFGGEPKQVIKNKLGDVYDYVSDLTSKQKEKCQGIVMIT